MLRERSRTPGMNVEDRGISSGDDALCVFRDLGVRPLTERVPSKRDILEA